MQLILGLDTSCYTTSLACADLDGFVPFQHRIPLQVKQGARGLQQSEGVFQHLGNLPKLTAALRTFLPPSSEIAAVCASTRPRPRSDSYMPVFKAAQALGQALADVLRVPFYEVSHQENHVMAGVFSAQGPQTEQFLAVHVSGGTTELLRAVRRETGFDLELLGATQDLHGGQLVDRIGIALGLPFPAGPCLEALAGRAPETALRLPVFLRGLTVGFSGAEDQALRRMHAGHPPEEIARALYHCLTDTLLGWLSTAVNRTGLHHILLVGGVTASTLLRQGLKTAQADGSLQAELFFADPALSADHGVGTALLGLKHYWKENQHHEQTSLYSPSTE